MDCLSDERLQEYANLGVHVVGFRPQTRNHEEEVADGFGKIIAVGLTAEVVSILAMVAGMM